MVSLKSLMRQEEAGKSHLSSFGPGPVLNPKSLQKGYFCSIVIVMNGPSRWGEEVPIISRKWGLLGDAKSLCLL